MNHHTCLALALAVSAASAAAAGEPIFRHSGFAQLSQGELGNAGQNLFVSARGGLKLINWFDLDRDGYPEIIINNEHNPYESVDGLIYFQHPTDGFRSLLPIQGTDGGEFDRLLALRAAATRTQFLPALGAGHSLIADLNRDGYPDIAFVNFIHGSTHDHFAIFIYWGGADGFSPQRRSEFPSETAGGLAATDLDGDLFDAVRGVAAGGAVKHAQRRHVAAFEEDQIEMAVAIEIGGFHIDGKARGQIGDAVEGKTVDALPVDARL